MSCSPTQQQLLDLPIEQFGTLAHLDDCDDCFGLARQIQAGTDVLQDDLNAFVSGGDFEAAFAAAKTTEIPQQSPTPVHGLLIALAAAAVLAFVAADELPSWATFGEQAGLAPALNSDDLAALELADDAMALEPDDLNNEEWIRLGDDLVDHALAFEDDDPAAFEIWLSVARVASITDNSDRMDQAVEWAASLAAIDSGLLELVDDSELRNQIQSRFHVRVEVVNPIGALVEIGNQRIDGSDATVWVDRGELPVQISVDGVPCGDLRPQESLEIHAGETSTVQLDGGRSVVECGLPNRVVPTPVLAPPAERPPVTDILLVKPEAPAPKDEKRTSDFDDFDDFDDDIEELDSGPSPCEKLTWLEPAALLGRLSIDEVACLHGRLNQGSQTERDRVSRMLMLNTWGLGDVDEWWKMAEEHLDMFATDPDLAYLYALYLGHRGQNEEAIYWADKALELKRRWVGERHVTMVGKLLRHRAICSSRIWHATEAEHLQNPTTQTHIQNWKTRTATKILAREWLDHAHEAGLPTNEARGLCGSAAATMEYCR